MLISLSRRFIFISNSKTGSTSFESALDPYAEIRTRGHAKHQTWREVREAWSFLFDHPDHRPETFFRFGVVRDPLDWFVSWYNYRLGSEVEWPLAPGTTIEQFWQRNDWTKFRKDGSKHLQKKHFTDADGVCRFDLVMPMDLLREYEQPLFARLGVEAKLPVENKSRKFLSSKDVAPALAAEIREFWAEDYAFLEEMRVRCRALLAPVTLAVDAVPPSVCEFMRVETVPAKGCAGMPLLLRGVVLPAEGVSADARLVLRRGNVPLPLECGLASAPLAEKHPGNPRAARARFVARDVVLAAGERAELWLEAPGQAGTRLAVLDTATAGGNAT